MVFRLITIIDLGDYFVKGEHPVKRAWFQGHPVNYVINGTFQNNVMTGDWKYGGKKGNLQPP